MGDIADMMMEGLLDYETGELIDGDAPGHPRTARWAKQYNRVPADKTPCPHCGKRVGGLQQHIEAKHANLAPFAEVQA